MHTILDLFGFEFRQFSTRSVPLLLSRDEHIAPDSESVCATLVGQQTLWPLLMNGFA